ncbi:DUF397 domain-containing protein [Thermomonospora cellulosilytica]|uniref:DUF397 domain-containing protein n=1 Tax=Thermomonospora cellulosilytica TaxID=1411118 RepID=A0A7W3MTN1_9ACTN|nr:DUF397 domain-containing protein [Thermomonospora cellulosilytica]MBA9001688.1 hypothetical protein [Thermomonospora cellulosilytica]
MSGPTWRKSTYSGSEQNACVEVADLADGIGLRDSKSPDAGHLKISAESFAALLHQIKQG